ncbi:PspC domain-containing protein [Sphingobacterium hungaricum]
MNKTIIININSIVFHIEEDAYDTLRSYMIDIKRHFGNSSDSKEILEDIENRIAEMFSERIHTGRKEVINLEDVNQVIAQMGKVSDFEGGETDEEETFTESASGQTFNTDYEVNNSIGKRLMRDPDDKTLGGVCSGLGHYFGIEAKWVRIMFILFFLFAGSGVLLYLILWVVMPLAQTRADRMAMRGEAPNLQNFKKSFEEEMSGFRENFSGAGEHISRGARSVGDVLGRIFGFFGKFVGILFTIFIGLSIVGMFIFLGMVSLSLAGLIDIQPFPPLEALSNSQAFIAFVAGWLATTLPFIALFLLLVRVLFKLKPMNNYVSLIMFSTWLVSLIVMLYFIIIANQDFREESTIKVEKKIEPQTVYYFDEKNVRVIEASDAEFGSKKFKFNFDGESGNAGLNSTIRVRFENLDSLTAPYIQYSYSAKGKTYQLASERAAQINYQAVQQGEKIFFNSHFSLGSDDLYRDQRVDATVYLPVGAKVVILENLQNKLRDISFYDCRNYYAEENQNIKSTEWVMTKNGLKCEMQLKGENLSEKELERAKKEAEKELEKAEKEVEKAKKEAEAAKKLVEDKLNSEETE